MVRWLLGGIWFLAVGGVFTVAARQNAAISRREFRLVSSPPMAELDRRILNVVTMGHKGLWEDVAMISAIQYLADQRLTEIPPETVAEGIRKIARHGVRHEALYMLACFILNETRQRPDLCRGILIDGMAAMPQSWRLPLTLAYMETYRLNSLDQGAVYYAVAATRPNAPGYLKSLALKLAQKGDLTPEDLETTLKGLLDAGMRSRLGSVMEVLKSPGSPPAGGSQAPGGG